MIALDTNVVVRYLVEDDARQSARAAAVIDRALRNSEPLFISQIVLCEVAWVLSAAYHFNRREIFEVLRDLAQAAQIVIEDADHVRAALVSFSSGKGDFADYIVRERALAAGCTRIVTFDKALLREANFF